MKLPYMSSPGTLTKILNKVREASTPDRFTGDYLASTLGFKGGNARTFIGWAKRVGLVGTDGAPTDTYKGFRTPSTSKAAMATALRRGYADLFDRNEACHSLSRKDLIALVVQSTGLDHDSRVVELVVATFMNAKEFADFSQPEANREGREQPPTQRVREDADAALDRPEIGLSYSIHLVLPKTDDPAVYDAIFRALRDNLLRD